MLCVLWFKPKWELHWRAENRERNLRYHAPALKELRIPVGLRVVELMMSLFKQGDEESRLVSFVEVNSALVCGERVEAAAAACHYDSD
jgi:hypothetical protein